MQGPEDAFVPANRGESGGDHLHTSVQTLTSWVWNSATRSGKEEKGDGKTQNLTCVCVLSPGKQENEVFLGNVATVLPSSGRVDSMRRSFRGQRRHPSTPSRRQEGQNGKTAA